MANSDLKFGVYTEMNCMPGVDTAEAVWDVMGHIEQCDRLGYDVYMAIEHHFFPTFGQSSNPLALFSAAAQRTQKIRFRTLCHTLPLHTPTVLAGEIATADVLTGGRLDLGFGRGHAWLYKMAGIPYEESQPRYEEAQEIIMKALTEERFSFHGNKYVVDDVTVYPRPVQAKMPVYLTGTSGRSFRFAAERGWGISVGGPAPYPIFVNAMKEYRDACAKAGHKPIVSWIQPVHIAPTENEAQAQARTAAPYFYHQIAKPILSIDQKADRERLLAAGYGFYASDAMNRMLELTYDDILAQDMVWVGTPAQIANKVADFLAKEELDEFAIQVLPRGPQGGLTLEQHRRVHELFAKEVMPAFK